MMMKANGFFIHLISIALALSMVCAVGVITAFAAPGEGQFGVPNDYDDLYGYNGQIGNQYDQQGDEQQNDEQQSDEQSGAQLDEQQNEEQHEEQYEEPNQWYDYLYSGDDGEAQYEEPEYLNELPEAASEQVVEATAVAMPVVAVSDASLLSGIIMWLCVALGIAVIVGVLVSKRTRRRGV